MRTLSFMFATRLLASVVKREREPVRQSGTPRRALWPIVGSEQYCVVFAERLTPGASQNLWNRGSGLRLTGETLSCR